jgi:hypothetical protein
MAAAIRALLVIGGVVMAKVSESIPPTTKDPGNGRHPRRESPMVFLHLLRNFLIRALFRQIGVGLRAAEIQF